MLGIEMVEKDKKDKKDKHEIDEAGFVQELICLGGALLSGRMLAVLGVYPLSIGLATQSIPACSVNRPGSKDQKFPVGSRPENSARGVQW